MNSDVNEHLQEFYSSGSYYLRPYLYSSAP